MNNLISLEKERIYRKWIIIVSIVIPMAVALLFRVQLKGVEPLHFLPPIYATINGVTAILLLLSFWAIRSGKKRLHQKLMTLCLFLSLAFLIMYVGYHMTSSNTPYGGAGWMKGLYFIILITHILLSIGVIPMVLFTYLRGWSGRYDAHKKLARITFPIWLYVAVTGVIVYLMISPYYR